VENKPKISGVAFNAYAIVGLLVITPIYLALVTSVAAGGTIEDKRYSMLPEDGYVRTDYTDTALHPGYFKTNGNNAIGTWIDIGDNMTQNYINEYGLLNDDGLECYWLYQQYPHYGHPDQQDFYGGPVSSAFVGDVNNFNINDVTNCQPFGRLKNVGSTSFSSDVVQINGISSVPIPQNHFSISSGSGHPYIGNSGGGEFKFSIENPVFQGLDDEKGVGSLFLTMYADYTNFQFDCDTAISDEISFNYNMEIFHKPGNQTTHPTTIQDNPSIKFDGWTFEGDNLLPMEYNPNGIICTTGFELNFQLSVFESMDLTDFKDIFGSYENFSAIITMDNFENVNNPGGLIGDTPLPFAGDGYFYMGYSVSYINEATTNFILKGGTLVLGLGFFWLSIASTPYYDPLKNRFKGAV